MNQGLETFSIDEASRYSVDYQKEHEISLMGIQREEKQYSRAGTSVEGIIDRVVEGIRDGD